MVSDFYNEEYFDVLVKKDDEEDVSEDIDELEEDDDDEIDLGDDKEEEQFQLLIKSSVTKTRVAGDLNLGNFFLKWYL